MKKEKNTMTNLSLSNIRQNRSRSILTVISIVLTTLLLTVIASYGYGIIKSNHVNAGNLYGTYHGAFAGVGQEQLRDMNLRGEFSEIGLSASAGSVQSVASDGVPNDVSMSLMWADETTGKLANLNRQLESGSFPQEVDEITAQPGFFRMLGYDDPQIGDTVQIKTRISMQDYVAPETFVISGLLKEDTSQGTSGSYQAFVSKAYYDSRVDPAQQSYNVYFRLSDSVPLTYSTAEDVMKELARDCGIDDRYVSENVAYIMWTTDPGTETIAGCALLAVVVIVFSVMVIYNIFQTGIAHRVREYGKIKALGATKKQMKKLVFLEGMLLSAAGIPIGLAAGYLTASLSFRALISRSDIAAVEGFVHVSLFSPVLLIAVAAVAALTVWIALKRPMKIVSSISPVEAMRWQGAETKKGGYRKGRKNISVGGMTLASLANNKKRTVTTILTMGLSCVLFVSMANFAGNMDASYDARKQLPYGQFQIQLDYSLNDTAYPENNLDQILKNNPLKNGLTDEIAQLSDVTGIRIQDRLSVTLRRDGAETKKAAVVVLSRKDFEREASQGSTLGDFSYDQASADDAIIYGWSHFLGDEGYGLNDMVEVTLDDGNETRDLKMPLIGAFGSMDAEWAITEDTYHRLGFEGDSPGVIWVDCATQDAERVQQQLYDLTSGVEYLSMDSYQDVLNTSEQGISMMKLFTYGLTGLIALISFMNMANTMITGIITRKQEFGILQAVGMTNGQLRKMLQQEGLFFTLGTVIVSVVFGVPIGYGLFWYGKTHSWIGLYEYHFPLAEIGLMILALALLQLFLSWMLSRNIRGESVVDRIRYQG